MSLLLLTQTHRMSSYEMKPTGDLPLWNIQCQVKKMWHIQLTKSHEPLPSMLHSYFRNLKELNYTFSAHMEVNMNALHCCALGDHLVFTHFLTPLFTIYLILRRMNAQAAYLLY